MGVGWPGGRGGNNKNMGGGNQDNMRGERAFLENGGGVGLVHKEKRVSEGRYMKG